MANKKEITDDEVLGKAYDAHLMKRLLKYLKPYRGWIFLAIVLTIGVSLSTTVRPYLTKIAIDNFRILYEMPDLSWINQNVTLIKIVRIIDI